MKSETEFDVFLKKALSNDDVENDSSHFRSRVMLALPENQGSMGIIKTVVLIICLSIVSFLMYIFSSEIFLLCSYINEFCAAVLQYKTPSTISMIVAGIFSLTLIVSVQNIIAD